jgi:regulator of cell morphogenesis and NO signaling
MININSTLGALVTEDPRRARVLEAHGLDFCCGGAQTFAEASEKKGLDAHALAAELDLPDRPAAPDWQNMGLAELADHIVATHHVFLWDEMEPLAALVDKVARVHGDRHPELAGIKDDYDALVDDLSQHLMKEERILFPAIHAQDAGEAGFGCGVAGPIRQMMFEHDAAGDLLRRLRAATDDYTAPADGCGSYQLMMTRLAALEADIHEHIHKENNVLFPRTLADAGASV